MAEPITVAVTAVGGVIAGAVGAAWKSRKNIEERYDVDLRQARVEAYKKMWALLEPLAYYFPAADLTRGTVRELGAALRHWYYTEGGLVMSESTRRIYLNLQVALVGASKRGDGREPHPDADVLQALGSRLRTASTRDVASRLGPRVGLRAVTLARQRLRRFRPIHATIDRRWAWTEKGERTAALYVIAENRSDREVDVSAIITPDGNSSASFRVQPGEAPETKLSVVQGAALLRPRARVKVGGFRLGSRTKWTLEVPVSTKELRRQ